MRYKDKNEALRKQRKAYDYLVRKGLKPHLASGIIGNLIQESYAHLDSTIENSIGAVGIAQWLGPRKASLKEFAKNQGTSHKDFDTQLDFLWQELNTTGDSWNRTKDKEAFFNAKTAEEAADIFVRKFERSGEKPGEKGYENRVRNAKSVYLQFNDKEVYAKNDKGQIVNVNPEAITPEQLALSPKIKAEFYEKNFDIINEKTAVTTAEPSKAAKEAEEALAAKKKNKEDREAFIAKLQEKNSITQEDVKKVEEMQPESSQPDPYSMDISTPGNEFFSFFLGNTDQPIAATEFQEGGAVPERSREQVVQESKDFVTDWFNDPETAARYSMNMSQGFSKTLPEIQKGLEDVKSATVEYDAPTSNESAGAGYQGNTISFYKDPTDETSTHEFTHAMGIDDNLTKYIRDNFGTPAAAIQQKTNKPFKESIAQEFSIDESTSFGRQKVQNTIEHSRYLSGNGELYPRIMEMRRILNVKPGDIISDEQVKSLEKTDNPLFKYYDTEQIKDILNTVADNSSNLNVNQAAMGGNISSDCGGPGQPPCKQTVTQEEAKGVMEYANKEIALGKERETYYNPTKIKNVNTGDKTIDFLYNNDWLINTPIIGDKIKEKAKKVMKSTFINHNVDGNVEKFIEKNKNWKATFTEGSPLSQKFNEKLDLTELYMGNDKGVAKSKYKPTSDYLEFLPSYSIKRNFDDIYRGKVNEGDEFDSGEFINYKLNHAINLLLEENPSFFKNKKTIFKSTSDQEASRPLITLMGINLGGYKEGMAWDKKLDLPYISISDAWDFEPKHYAGKYGKENENYEKNYVQSSLLHKAGKPFKVYDRFYFDPETKEYIPDDKIKSYKNKNNKNGKTNN